MVWALIILLLFSSPAYADELEEIEEEEIVEVVTQTDLETYEQTLNQIVSDQNVTIDTLADTVSTLADEVRETQENESEETEENQEESEVPSDAVLRVVLVDEVAEKNLEAEPTRSASGSVYQTLTNGSSGATYLASMLNKLGWADDYVAWQDTNASYVLAYGDIEYENGVFLSDSCDYIRYYRTQQTNWMYETGTSSLNLNPQGYGVLSSLGQYPLLGDGNHEILLFFEFLAILCISIYSFRTVFAFLLRMRS